MDTQTERVPLKPPPIRIPTNTQPSLVMQRPQRCKCGTCKFRRRYYRQMKKPPAIPMIAVIRTGWSHNPWAGTLPYIKLPNK
jgi:hypothetical protein